MISTIHRTFKKNTAHRHLELTDEQYDKIFGAGNNAQTLSCQGWRLKAFQLLEFIPLEEHQQIYSELLQGHIQYVKVHRPNNGRIIKWGRGTGKSLFGPLEDMEEYRKSLKPEIYEREYLGTWESDK